MFHGRGLSINRKGKQKLVLAAIALLPAAAVHHASAANYTWDPAKSGASGGTGPWDTTSTFWDTGTNVAGTATTWVNGQNAIFGGIAGTVSVDPGGISLNTATFTTVGYTLQSGPIALTGTTPQIYAAGGTATGVGTTTVNSVLTGTAGLKLAAGGYSVGTINIGALNTYTGPTVISAVSIYFSTIANAGTPSAFGDGSAAGGTTGTIELATSGSTLHLDYTGPAGSTDRLYQLGITGTSTADIINNGTGPLAFNATGSAITGTASTKKLQLDGTLANASVTSGVSNLSTNANTFAETISDSGGSGSITSVSVASSTWALTGTNTYTGNTAVSNGAQIIVNNSASLGAGTLSYTGSGTVSASTGVTIANPVSVGTGITANFYNFNTGTSATPGFIVNGLISGAGGVRLSTPSNSTFAPIEISSDFNSFSGLFSIGNGFIEYTSVANVGSPSALGTGATSGTISIQNGASFATFQYLGANVDFTNRPLVYTGYSSGNLALDSSGAGAVQFLATNPIRAGISTVANTNTIFLTGTSTGSNVLNQVINDNVASGSIVAGVTSVTKSLAGSWILTGANTYTGTTAISAGSLTIDASDGGTTLAGVTPNAAASIAGSGTVTITGGTLHLLNSAAGGAVSMLSSNAVVSVPSTGTPLLLDLNGNTQTISTFVVGGTNQDAGTYGSANYFAGLVGGPTLTTEQSNDEALFGTGNGAFVVTNAPEPSSIALLGVGTAGLLRRRRRSLPVI